MSIRNLFAWTIAATIAAAALGGSATASGPRATKGDATAVLQAFGNGGFAVLQHSKTAEGAPSQGLPGRVAIRPFPGSPFDGAHYCELDWHTILIADIEGGDRTFKRQEAEATISQLTVSFTLDGAPLAVSRTAVKRFLDPQRFDLDVAYYAQWGQVMAPSELTVGAHTLEGMMSDSTGTIFDGVITFYVDAAGTGACL